MVNFLNLDYIFLWIYDTAKSFNVVAIINWVIAYILDPIRPFAALVTIFMVVWLTYSIIRFHQIEEEEKRKFAIQKKELDVDVKEQSDLSAKWIDVEKNINSTNPSDWRVAIVDADIMLGTILSRQGYQGATIGDQLKAVDKADMLTLQDAWNAHLVRNNIAHGGTDFQLNEREAKATIALYKKVFQEFYHI